MDNAKTFIGQCAQGGTGAHYAGPTPLPNTRSTMFDDDTISSNIFDINTTF